MQGRIDNGKKMALSKMPDDDKDSFTEEICQIEGVKIFRDLSGKLGCYADYASESFTNPKLKPSQSALEGAKVFGTPGR